MPPLSSKKRTQANLTPLELELMKVLWTIGSGSVQAVSEKLPGDKLAYTTVQTMLNVLEGKGKVTRVLQDRAYVYSPALSRAQAISSTMGDLIHRMFDGSAEALVMGLLESKHLTPKRLAELQRKVKENEGERP